MTWFAFSIWAWKITGQATTLALVLFFSYIPTLLFGPIAGALLTAGIKNWSWRSATWGQPWQTLAVLLLYLANLLQVWHLYVAVVFAGVFCLFNSRLIPPRPPLWSRKINMHAPKGCLD